MEEKWIDDNHDRKSRIIRPSDAIAGTSNEFSLHASREPRGLDKGTHN